MLCPTKIAAELGQSQVRIGHDCQLRQLRVGSRTSAAEQRLLAARHCMAELNKRSHASHEHARAPPVSHTSESLTSA